jgi:hypothetical protein
MTWSAIGGYGSDENKTAGVNLKIYQPGTSISAGSVIVVIIACDNTQTTDGESSTVTSVIGTHSGTFTKALEYTNGAGAAAAGVTCGLWYKRLTSTLGAGDDEIDITFPSSVVAKATYAYIFSTTTSHCNVAFVYGSANDVDPASMGISGLPSREYLFIRAVATERGNYDFVPSTNYTPFGQNTTTSGGDQTDVAIAAEYRIVTTTGGTTDPSTGTPESASVYAAFMDVPNVVPVNVTGVSGTTNLGTATTGVRQRPTATGISATASIGSVTQSGKANHTITGTGFPATASLGTATAKTNVSPTVTGVQATASLGVASSGAAFSAALTGVSSTGEVGSTTQTGTANITLSGVAGTTSLGTIFGSVPNVAVLSGFGVTASLGDVVARANSVTSASGLSAMASVGVVNALTGTVAIPSYPAAMALSIGAVTAVQANTRVAIELSGMSMSLGTIGIRAWGLVNDNAPAAWAEIQTEE